MLLLVMSHQKPTGLQYFRKDIWLIGRKGRSSRHGAVEMNPTRNHEAPVRSLASLSGLKIWHFCEVWCRSQTRLRSGMAVAVAAIDPIRSLAWEPAVGAALKRQKDKKKKDKEECRTVAVQPFDLSFPLMFVPLFVPKSIYLLNIPVVSN